MEPSAILDTAKRTLLLESQALQDLAAFLNDDFEKVVHLIAHTTGRIVVTGIGKSTIIGHKIVATLNSTGTPALFMHAADAIHGDLGMMQTGDIVICLSKSGTSPEIRVLVPLIKNFNNSLIAITGNMDSYLALQADYVLNATVSQEACPNNLAPTASTTAQLALGDALAVCLMEYKGFTQEDFARFHPGGLLGKKLYLHVQDLSVLNRAPAVPRDAPMKEVILKITADRLGMTAVTDHDGKIKGIITDGDLRRMLKGSPDWQALTAADVMNPDPKTIRAEELAVNALALMRQNNITQLIVLKDGDYAGVIHLHDLLKEGLI
jgi:arabinose-5-phosphate isomerase